MIDKAHLDDERTVLFYQALLEKHGNSFRALNWGSVESQIKRFEVLAEVGLKSGDSILDVGCGLADLHAWILEQNLRVNYTGIDITPSMTREAQNRFPDVVITNNTIFDNDLSDDVFDYVVARESSFFERRPNGAHGEGCFCNVSKVCQRHSIQLIKCVGCRKNRTRVLCRSRKSSRILQKTVSIYHFAA